MKQLSVYAFAMVLTASCTCDRESQARSKTRHMKDCGISSSQSGEMSCGTVMPSPFVIRDLTLGEALDSFYKWYKSTRPPLQQTISVSVDALPPEYGLKKATVDLSGIQAGDAIIRIAEAYGLTARFRNGRYVVRMSEN